MQLHARTFSLYCVSSIYLGKSFFLCKYLSFVLGSISKYRIDGKKMNTVWTFSNDQLITRCYWYPGEPNANLASIGLNVGYGGQWDGINPTFAHGCICEKDINFN